MLTAKDVDVAPGDGWRADGALNFPDTWTLIEKHLPAEFPMPASMFMAIFFEETAACNVVQQGTPAGIGPGQMQVSEIGKVDFFACQDSAKDNFMGGKWDSSMTILAVNQATVKTFMRTKPLHPSLGRLTKEFILGDNEFAIKMHIKFMQWLARGFGADGKTKGLGGLLAAQTGGGGNTAARQGFLNGSKAISDAMKPDGGVTLNMSAADRKAAIVRRRKQFIAALNTARREFRNNAVPEARQKFWEFFLPDEFVLRPNAYLAIPD